jgi:hypothetical protein
MRRRAVAVVDTQVISPVMAMLVALVIALILLLAAPVKAQETTAEETTAEETTVLAADAANRKVEAETDNVSVEVDNGKVSVNTSNGSSSNKGTSQQSSVTVQQNQTDEGSGSRASTGDVNIGATQTSTGCQNPRNVLTFSGTKDRLPTDSFQINGDHFRLQFTTDPNPANTTRTVKVNVDVLTANQQDTGEGFTANDGSDGSDNVPRGPGTFRLDITADNARYDITVEDCRGNNNNNNNNRNRRHHDRDRNRHHHRHHDRDRHHNRFGRGDFGRGAASRQYERIVEERVIRETVPDKGRLAATGGVPLTGAAFLGLASVGLGVSILRFAIRRDP